MLRVLQAHGLPVKSTNKHELAWHRGHPLVMRFAAYKVAQNRSSMHGKRWPTFVNPATGRIHPDWKQNSAVTGRYSCGTPNLQQIPNQASYRALIAAPAGRVLVQADYKALEMWLVAEVAPDEVLLEAFARGDDVHERTAARVLGKPESEVTNAERKLGKTINFAFLYGQKAAGLRQKIYEDTGRDISLEEAEVYREAYFELYPALRAWHERSRGATSYVTRTLLGRRRLGVESTNARLNTPIQSLGADLLKTAQARLFERRAEMADAFPVISCHDEIVYEANAADQERVEELLVETMQEALAGLITRVQIEVEHRRGLNWAEKD